MMHTSLVVVVAGMLKVFLERVGVSQVFADVYRQPMATLCLRYFC